MCSIFGIGFLRGHKFRNKSTVTGVVSRLFKEAESGGRKAAGVSIMNEKSVNVLRRPMSGSQLVGTEEYLGFMQERLEFEKAGRYTMSIIGHCRWPTQGSPSNNLNNHPLVIDNIIGVHNGVITNDYNLFKEFRTLKRLAEVDTEIIFQLIALYSTTREKSTIEAIKKASEVLVGSYACAVQNTHHPYNLYLFRKGNPIKTLHYPDLGIIIFATREHFITTAFEEFVDGFGEGKPIDLLDQQGVAFNLWESRMSKFLFREK